ncbi:hypothetical protein Bca4012_003287 [Brassica carinata]
MVHSYASGSGPNAAALRPQIIRPTHQHKMANQLANIEGLQKQTFVPRPLFGPAQTYFVQQPHHLNAIDFSMYRYYPYMRPEANHFFRSDQMFTLTSPSGQPRSFVLSEPANILCLLQYPTQTQRLDDGPSSHQGQHQQQQAKPRHVN